MRTPIMLSAALAMLLCGCGSAATSPGRVDTSAAAEAVAAPSPAASAGKIAAQATTAAPAPASAFAGASVENDGALRTITLGGRKLEFQPIKLGGLRPGVGKACGLRIGGSDIVTLGVGDAEAYECYGLAQSGELPPLAGKNRIGLVYESGSPNANFLAGIILIETAAGWTLDTASIGTYDDLPAAAPLAALRKAVGN